MIDAKPVDEISSKENGIDMLAGDTKKVFQAVISYLGARKGMEPAEIAEIAGLSIDQVNAVTPDLLQSGILTFDAKGFHPSDSTIVKWAAKHKV